MKQITEAMDGFFKRQAEKWESYDHCKPRYPWDEEFDQSLFVSGPDEDEYAEWLPQAGRIPANMPPLCPELRQFFGSRRFWQMAGSYKGYDVNFPAVPTDEEAVRVAAAAIENGEFHAGKGMALLASVSYQDRGDLWLMYQQGTGKLYLYDMDDESLRPLGFSLVELVDQMEALL